VKKLESEGFLTSNHRAPVDLHFRRSPTAKKIVR